MTTATTQLTALTGTYTLDPAHSRIGFVARHAMVTKVRGAFNDFEGTAVLDGDNPANSSANVTIQVNSIDTRQAQRDEHLRSNDFLSMDEYPTITFVSTGARALDDLSGTYVIDAAHTRIGFVARHAMVTKVRGAINEFEGSAVVINRKDFGVNFNAALETGGVLVSDKITLEFEISAIKNAA